MKLYGQRWRYLLANTEVLVDNAFSWFGWAQERLLINQEVARVTGQWFGFRRSFSEDWLTPTGDGELSVVMRSTLNGVTCDVKLDGESIEFESLFGCNWHGRRIWPPEHNWIATDQFTVFGSPPST